jgi:DNA-binding IclR family transcriptional regulator
MPTGTESNKAKIAKRVIEVLDYFDDDHPQATVMDIVRRYDRPQSSTSELLSSLVSLGLLYKDPYSRSYSLTPRAAMLGAASQPEWLRHGALSQLVDSLVAQTGLTVAVFGMVGVNAQIFKLKPGSPPPIASANPRGLASGLLEQLSHSAPGWLLLSTVPQPRRERVVRRLNAEAADNRKFCTAEMNATLSDCVDNGSANGVAGFGTIADCACVLLPGQAEHQALAIGFIYEPGEGVDPAALIECLREGVARMMRPVERDVAPVALLSSAA